MRADGWASECAIWFRLLSLNTNSNKKMIVYVCVCNKTVYVYRIACNIVIQFCMTHDRINNKKNLVSKLFSRVDWDMLCSVYSVISSFVFTQFTISFINLTGCWHFHINFVNAVFKPKYSINCTTFFFSARHEGGQSPICLHTV